MFVVALDVGNSLSALGIEAAYPIYVDSCRS